MKSLIFALLPLCTIGCGNDSSNDMGGSDMAMAAGSLGTPPSLAIPCNDAVADVYTRPSSLPAVDGTHRGDVFHCATAESLTTEKANAQSTHSTDAAASQV